MLFNSFYFLFFFITVSTVYFALAHRYRWIWLLLASCTFYISFVPIYIILLGINITIDYFIGIHIEKNEGKKRKQLLILSLAANIGILSFFKYYNFFNDNIHAFLFGTDHQNPIPYLSILLPIGLSFHTFQAMSYIIEVYRGNQKAEKHFGIYSLYILFYPQLIAGPIERPQNMLHQFHQKHAFNFNRIVDGLKLMLWGYFMKIVIADRLALYVDAVYNNSELHQGKSLALATVFFAIQIYCDFAGYSNIAIGAAKVIGFELSTNFKRPYFSNSFSEFWNRWHISLSSWFRDYLYFSIGGNRVNLVKWCLNIMIVFLISGLWHGANWTFVIWGCVNGLLLVLAVIYSRPLFKHIRSLFQKASYLIRNPFQILLTFTLICFTWVFFRSDNATQSFNILNKISHFGGELFVPSKQQMTYCIIAIGLLFFIELKMEFKKELALPFTSRSWFKEQLFYSSLLMLIIMNGVFNGGQFIYFQF